MPTLSPTPNHVNPQPAITPEAWRSWALYYVGLGFGVLPLQPRGKAPLASHAPSGLKSATTDAAQIEAWFTSFCAASPCPNLGIVPPDGVIAVDVDPRNGGTFDDLPDTRLQATVNGGGHALYTVEPGMSWPSKLRQGVDIKSTKSGYIVAAPSVVQRDDGTLGAYAWLDPTAPIVPAPPCVAALSRAADNLEPAPAPRVTTDDAISDDQVETIAAWLAERMIDGSKHKTMHGFGGWCAQRELSESDVERLAEAVLSTRQTTHGDVRSVAAGVKGTLEGYGGHSVHGASVLAEGLEGGETAREELNAMVPNPKRARELAERDALAAFIPTEVPAVANDVLHGAPSAPAWLRPVDDSDDGPLYRRLVAEGFDLARGCVTAVQGPPRRGKTPLMFQLLYAIANGSRFLDLQCERGKCALFTWEKVAATKARKATVARAMGVDRGGVELFVVSAPLTLQTAAELAAFIRAQGFDAVGLDTLNSAMGSADQNEMSSAAPLKALALALPDTAIVVSVYERKSAAGADSDLQSVAGSNAIGGGFDAAVRLKPADGSRNKYTLESTRELTTEPKPIEIEARGDEHAMCFHVVEPDVLTGAGSTAVELTNEKQKFERAIERIENTVLNWHTLMPDRQGGMTVRDWASQIRMGGGRNYDVVRRALDSLTKADVLRCEKGTGRNGSSNKYRPPKDDDAGVIAERKWNEFQSQPRPEYSVPAVPNR